MCLMFAQENWINICDFLDISISESLNVDISRSGTLNVDISRSGWVIDPHLDISTFHESQYAADVFFCFALTAQRHFSSIMDLGYMNMFRWKYYFEQKIVLHYGKITREKLLYGALYHTIVRLYSNCPSHLLHYQTFIWKILKACPTNWSSNLPLAK